MFNRPDDCRDQLLTIADPDDPMGMPIYEGSAADASKSLIPGVYMAEGLDAESTYVLTIREGEEVPLGDMKAQERFATPENPVPHTVTGVSRPIKGFTAVGFVDDEGRQGEYLHRSSHVITRLGPEPGLAGADGLDESDESDESVSATPERQGGVWTEDGTSKTWTGDKYVADRHPTETARVMRSEINAMRKAGELPSEFTYSVTRSYNWNSFEIEVKGGTEDDLYEDVPGAELSGSGRMRTPRPDVKSLGDKLSAVGRQYIKHTSAPADNYSSGGNVRVLVLGGRTIA